MARALDESVIAHTVINDLYKPLSRDALEMALARSMTTVFFLDTDETVKMRNMVEAGLLGRKSGKGFYDYTKK
mgnify:CR=1 FL=1